MNHFNQPQIGVELSCDMVFERKAEMGENEEDSKSCLQFMVVCVSLLYIQEHYQLVCKFK